MPLNPSPRRRRRRTSATTVDRPEIRAAILEAVDNQLRDPDLPEVRQTLERLMRAGTSENAARLYIGMVLLIEMKDVLATDAPFLRERYVKALNDLPRLPL